MFQNGTEWAFDDKFYFVSAVRYCNCKRCNQSAIKVTINDNQSSQYSNISAHKHHYIQTIRTSKHYSYPHTKYRSSYPTLSNHNHNISIFFDLLPRYIFNFESASTVSYGFICHLIIIPIYILHPIQQAFFIKISYIIETVKRYDISI